MPEDPSEVLIERFQTGNEREEGFRGIFALYYPRIMKFFLWRGVSQDESRDLTQESLLQIYQSLPAFRRESHFGRWAFEVSRRVYFNEVRRRSAAKRHGLDQSLDFDPPGEAGLGLPEPGPSPESQAIRSEQSAAFKGALQELPEPMRQCCKLRYEEGLKYQEIAIVMKISIEMVKAHLHQARKRLQERLGEVEEP